MATKVELARRVQLVKELLLDGYTRSHIIRELQKTAKISGRAVDQYIHDASEEILEINKSSAESNLSVISSALWKLYRKSVATFDNKTARQILMDIARLRGLDEQTVNLKIDRPATELSDEELSAGLSDD